MIPERGYIKDVLKKSPCTQQDLNAKIIPQDPFLGYGWDKAIENALKKMLKDGEILKDRQGKYYLIS